MSNLTLDERESAAWSAGDHDLASVLRELINTREQNRTMRDALVSITDHVKRITENIDDLISEYRIDLSACVDCLMYIANGDMPTDNFDWSADNVAINWPAPWQLHAGDTDKDTEFSRRACRCCGSPLAGARHHVIAFQPHDDAGVHAALRTAAKQAADELNELIESIEE